MPDLTEAELTDLGWRASEAHPDYPKAVADDIPRLIAKVRRLRAENAELRKRAEWRETFRMKDNPAKACEGDTMQA